MSYLYMHRLFVFLLVAIIAFVGMNPFSGSSFSQGKVKIQVIHNHEHQHDHENPNDLLHVISSSNDKTDNTNAHTHEIIIFVYSVFTETNVILTVFADFPHSYPAPIDYALPRSRSLGSIFRPPILS